MQQLLDSYSWYVSLPADGQAWLQGRIRERRLAAGETLAHDGRIATHAYMVLDGLMIWAVTGADGSQATIGSMLQGSWFGHATLLSQAPQRGQIVALRESRVACIPKDAFDWLLANSIAFNNALVRHAFARMQWFLGSFISRSLLSVDQQVARTLTFMIDEEQNPGAPDSITISQEELAYLAGFSRQRCNSALKRLQAGGAIGMHYGTIAILEKESLRALASGTVPPTAGGRAR